MFLKDVLRFQWPRLRLEVLVKALDGFAQMVETVSPADQVAPGWEALLSTASQL